MPSSQETVDFIIDQMSGAGDVSARKMFGEYGVYCNGKFVALICDDTLFIKPTTAGQAFAPKLGEGLPYPGAKPHPYVDAERLEDADWLAQLIAITTDALPAPKPKKPRGKKKS